MSDFEDKIISGKIISQQIRDEVKEEVTTLKQQGIYPHLVVILVGDDPGSHVYVRNKEIGSAYCGIGSTVIRESKDIKEKDLLQIIKGLNKDKNVHGILVQMPIPEHISKEKVILAIDPAKDVDGFHPYNVGQMFYGNQDAMMPCTPSGIIELLDRENIEISGKQVVVVGRSNIVGKPVFHMLLERNATVTICHSKTKNLPFITQQADILVVAIGKANMINNEHVKEGAVVIDVGVNRVGDKLYGDVDFISVAPIASRITPVPGGVGPMTIAMLMKNTVKAAKLSKR
ncbi:MAG: tetrahydrofolate dehydrogenase/cyclohydrolase catalytic domain-containing protein [Candidatus Riflemargulisbacteria bacterium]